MESTLPNLEKPGNHDHTGYDASRNLQILPMNKRTSFYLVAGADLEVGTDDENVALATAGRDDNKAAHKDSALTAWEKGQVIRIVSITGKSPGTTLLHAKQNGADMIEPLTIRVTNNVESRQVGKAKGEVTPDLRKELQGLSLRDAVIRVAEDQMNSAISTGSGFGVYNMDKTLDWCGGFAYWCWDQACAIQGVDNPFGDKNTVLWSPQRAIHWGIQPTTPVQVLRYKGVSPMDGKGSQDFHDLGWNGYDLKPADIVLLRKTTDNGWKHVCMVHSAPTSKAGDVETIDGNQGTGRSIKINNRSMDAKVAGGGYELVFLAVMRA